MELQEDRIIRPRHAVMSDMDPDLDALDLSGQLFRYRQVGLLAVVARERSRGRALETRQIRRRGSGALGIRGMYLSVDRCLGARYSSGSRAVAQLGSAPEWGSGGREFESRRPDHARNTTECRGAPNQHGLG